MSMDLPIWAKDKGGKWTVFPFHLLDTQNGFRGLFFHWGERNPEKIDCLHKFRHYFGRYQATQHGSWYNLIMKDTT